VIILTLQSSTFFFYVVIYTTVTCLWCVHPCVHLPVDLIRKGMFCVWELFKGRPTTDKTVDVAGLKRLSFKIIISQILRSLKWPCLRLLSITGPYAEWFVSYPLLYCRFQTGIPYTCFRLWAHGGCDLSAADPQVTPPWHLILPSPLSGICVALHSIFLLKKHVLLKLRINNTNKLFSKTMKITTKILFILIISIILTAQILFFH
jgi:hypothetical protein